MHTKGKGIAIILAITIIVPLAQALLKIGSHKLSFAPLALLMNWELLVGVCLYLGSSLAMLVAFRSADLSLLYPMFGLNYVWVNLVSYFYFNEPFGILRIVGIGLIVVSVIVIGYSGREATS